MTAWHLAVDFGTSNTAAAHCETDGHIDVVQLGTRSPLMPSAVYDNNGELVVGDEALSLAVADPSGLVSSPKRLIGHDHIDIRGTRFPTDSVVGAVFTHILDCAKALHAGTMPESVTLTYPEAWDQYAINQLIKGVEHAGIEKHRVRSLSEPRAAAVHYAREGKIAPGSNVGVFDFGGGTLDVAVLRAQDKGDFQVIATRGDNSVGGRTVDSLMYQWVVDKIGHDDPDLADSLHSATPTVMHNLQMSIRRAKEMLSETSSATIEVSTPEGEEHILITRSEFNDLIQGVCDRSRELMAAALQEAGAPAQSTPIFMTGGSSRIPHMQNELAHVGYVMTLDDPKTVVCRGALRANTLGVTNTHGKPPAPKTHVKPATQKAAFAPGVSSTSKKASNKTKVIAAVSVVALAAVGIGAAALLGGGEDTPTNVAGPNATTSTGEPASTQTTGAPSEADGGNSEVVKSDDPGHVTNMIPGIADIAPAPLLNRLNRCSWVQPGSLGVKAVDGAPEAMLNCVVRVDDRPETGRALYENRLVAFGKSAEKNYEFAVDEAEKRSVWMMQAPSEGKPEVQIFNFDEGKGWSAYYPDDEILIIADAPTSDEWQVQQVLREEGLIK
ncbi:Hsp70 family protein [Corynebacterium breve]|uniref:Hsp70 family protein n=1 Tax=Corynebacterium breve TaxID=3049799 RepID=A0ABY8VCP1_9CORY|nr:Hsp70 family protein [Corynebacterium breve]WIM67258.1 Hsp70 family protein [Corynebacterium breve]